MSLSNLSKYTFQAFTIFDASFWQKSLLNSHIELSLEEILYKLTQKCLMCASVKNTCEGSYVESSLSFLKISYIPV